MLRRNADHFGPEAGLQRVWETFWVLVESFATLRSSRAVAPYRALFGREILGTLTRGCEPPIKLSHCGVRHTLEVISEESLGG